MGPMEDRPPKGSSALSLGGVRKSIDVVAAVIVDDGRILATQRGYGEFEGGWEFPGGKVEPGETPEDALRREMREELGARVEVGRLLSTVEYDYPTFHLNMACFLCTLTDGGFELLEHHAARWLGARDIDSVAWLPADAGVVEQIVREGVAR